MTANFPLSVLSAGVLLNRNSQVVYLICSYRLAMAVLSVLSGLPVLALWGIGCEKCNTV